ncbi:hypothetical protein SAMN05428952_1004126 [Nitrosomonas sp. Nm132]|nr:hypothetical protein SAMN05428952_1004126 [Nitrosomonas sp. Nm132]
MANNIDELRDALSKVDIEEQRVLLKRFIESTTEESVLEGIRIANESISLIHQEFLVSSHVRE